MNFCRYVLSALLPAALLSGCVVYVPTVPSTPLLTSKGDIEATASVRALSSGELSVAWAPAPKLFLVGEGALQKSNGSETTNNTAITYTNLHLQGGLGMGTYRLLGPDKSLYLGAVGGVGFAKANIYDNHLTGYFLFFPLFGPLIHYEASYQRYYGQVYLAQQTPTVSYGLSMRTTFVNYSTLQRNGVDIAPPTRLFLEPTLFVRFGSGAVQGMGTIGISTPGRFDRTNPDNVNLAPINMLISAGIVVRPQAFRRRTVE